MPSYTLSGMSVFARRSSGVAHELARDVHRHIAATDHCDAFRFERPFAHAGRVAVVPLHKARGTVHAVEIGARNRERLVFDRTGREQNRVIPLQQILERHILAELDRRPYRWMFGLSSVFSSADAMNLIDG